MSERCCPTPIDFTHPMQPFSLPVTLNGRRSRIPHSAHRILGLRRGELDPVQIILAAQVRLRRWRRSFPGDPQLEGDMANCVPPDGQVQRIIRARDNLLSIANRQAVSPPGPRLD